MGRYRKKPFEVEAWLFQGADSVRFAPAWLRDAMYHGIVRVGRDATSNPEHLTIKTLEGEMRAFAGEHYIICGVQHELYPCRKDIFEATYEPSEP
jgi:hypothetical protein